MQSNESNGNRMADVGLPKNLKPIPINPFLLKRAEGLIAELRAIERDKGKGLCGNSPRPRFKRKPGVITKRPTFVHVEPPDNPELFVAPEIQRLLYQKFEEHCRRRKLSIAGDLPPAICKLLLLELFSNIAIVKAPASLLILVSVIHGGMNRLVEEYREFAGAEDLFRYVILGYTSDPEAAFRRIRKIVQRLEKDSRFKRIRGYPNLFLEAAVHYPTDPEAFLLRILRSVDRLENDGRFAEFRGSPDVYLQAVLHYPSDPDGALLRLISVTLTG